MDSNARAARDDGGVGPTADGAWRLGYRPELDGLRGIAILLVLISHFALGGRAGGLAGVTLFFVLSGFLITSLLLTEHRDTGRIALGAFYARRARRLLPALVVTATAVTIWQVLARGVDGLWPGVAALSYVSNWLIIAGADLEPLAHTWSLAIEEQFYLFWPLVLILVLRYRARWFGVALVGVAAGSVAWRAVLVAGDASIYRIAYGFDARADAIVVGCALAVLVVRGWRPPQVPTWVGLGALILVGMLTWYTTLGLTVGLAATAALSCVAITIGLRGSRALAADPLVRLGRLSYGLYLYHLPLMLLVGPVAGLALTFVVAIASHRWIEAPFMRRRTDAAEPPRAGGPLPAMVVREGKTVG